MTMTPPPELFHARCARPGYCTRSYWHHMVVVSPQMSGPYAANMIGLRPGGRIWIGNHGRLNMASASASSSSAHLHRGACSTVYTIGIIWWLCRYKCRSIHVCCQYDRSHTWWQNMDRQSRTVENRHGYRAPSTGLARHAAGAARSWTQDWHGVQPRGAAPARVQLRWCAPRQWAGRPRLAQNLKFTGVTHNFPVDPAV